MSHPKKISPLLCAQRYSLPRTPKGFEQKKLLLFHDDGSRKPPQWRPRRHRATNTDPTNNLTTRRAAPRIFIYFYPLTARTMLPATALALRQEEDPGTRKLNTERESTRPAPQRRFGGRQWRRRERLEGGGAGERGDAACADWKEVGRQCVCVLLHVV